MKFLSFHHNTESSSPVAVFLVRAVMLAFCGAGICIPLSAEDDLDFFEEKIHPVLIDYCYKCHSDEADEPAGGLFLHTQSGIREGGETGPAVVPNDIDESLLISAMEYRDLEMPPEEKLDDEIIANFRKWIEMGAPDPRTDDDDDSHVSMSQKEPPVSPTTSGKNRQQGYQLERDKKDRVVAVQYSGTKGLRAIKLHSYAHLQSVQVAAFTTLTTDDIDVLSKLNRVVELRLGNHLSDESVKIEGDLSKLGEMKSLESLFICKHNVVDEDLKFVARLPNLTSMEFSAFTNEDNETGPSVTDQCVKYLGKATKLKNLRISFGDFTDQFIFDLAKRLPELTSLDISSTQISDKAIGHLAYVKKLESLYLDSDSLTPDCLVRLSGQDRLTHVGLTVTNVTDHGLRVLAELPKLKSASLHSAKLTNDQLSVFRNHSTLQTLHFDGSNLSPGEVLTVIKTMPKLSHLGVGGKNADLQTLVNQFFDRKKLQ